MANQYLLLWLEAPLQSWGHDSVFGRRDTLKFPTKSGVLGIILSSMGASGPQQELLHKFSNLTQTIISFIPDGIGHPIKNYQPPNLLCDFQVVGNGYNPNNLFESLFIPKTKKGSSATGGGSKLTYRNYLQDSKFSAILEIPEDLSDDICGALKDPAWDIYLGRKNCVPTDYVYKGIFNDEKSAIDFAMEIALTKKLSERFMVIDGDSDIASETFFINDIPTQFGEQKNISIDR